MQLIVISSHAFFLGLNNLLWGKTKAGNRLHTYRRGFESCRSTFHNFLLIFVKWKIPSMSSLNIYLWKISLWIYRPLGYQRVYLPLYKVADIPFHIQRDDILINAARIKRYNYIIYNYTQQVFIVHSSYTNV